MGRGQAWILAKKNFMDCLNISFIFTFFALHFETGKQKYIKQCHEFANSQVKG